MPASPSAESAIGLLLLIVLAGASLVASWLQRPGRSLVPGRSPSTACVAFGGLGSSLLTLFGAGFRDYGGVIENPVGPSGPRCAQWWMEIGSSTGANPGEGDVSGFCHQAAIDAVAPAFVASLAVGMVAALAIVVLLRRRHVAASWANAPSEQGRAACQ